MVVHHALVEWMRAQMDERDWTMADLARRMDVQPSVISRWMRVRQPDPESVRRIAAAFGADEDELLALAGHRVRQSPVESAEVGHLIAMLRRIRLTPDRYWVLNRMLSAMVAEERKEYPTPRE